VGTLILFSPPGVESTLATLPSVAALLPPPEAEGVPSKAFPDALRKTEREVYRWIANTHYEHLAEVIVDLEHAHASGCTFGDLLTTTSRHQFVSLGAEMLVADDLLRRGYTVRTIPRLGQPGPDLHVTVDGIEVAVEVYSPRELLAVDTWIHEVSDLLQYVDVPATYRSRVATTFEQTIPPDARLHDPWALADMLAETREHVIDAISGDVEVALRKLRPLDKEYAHPGTPLRTTVELDDVGPADPRGPRRRGVISHPGFGGYSPADVFKTIVERAEKKARRRQAQGVAAAARALVVYLMGTMIAEDLTHPGHLRGAEAAVGAIEPQEHGLDVIAFVVRALPRGLAAILTVADDTTLTIRQVEAMFGQRS
jgi:hypothetical protein